jgi:hypothetical protein
MLVGVHSDAVSDSMDEPITISGIVDHRSSDGVDRRRRDTGTDVLDRRGLGAPQHVVGVDESLRRFADHEHPRRVGGVAILATSEVDDDGVTQPYDSWWGDAPFGPDATIQKSMTS